LSKLNSKSRRKHAEARLILLTILTGCVWHTLFLKDLYDNLKLSVTISGLLTAWSSSTHLVRGTGPEHSSIRYRFERISSDEVRAFFYLKYDK
jgi:hypothetical protein